MIKAILAQGLNGEIGQNGGMPWGRGLPKDLEYFKKVTGSDPVIMGRKTYESLNLPEGLPNRCNWVITSQEKETIWQRNDFNEVSFDSFRFTCNVLDCSKRAGYDWELTIIGGAAIYEQFWERVEEVHVTTVKHSFPEADTFFTPDLSDFEKVGDEIDVSSDEYEASVQVWRKKQNNI